MAIDRAGSDVSLIVTEDIPGTNGIMVGDRMYITRTALEGGKYAETLVHEYMHFEEGSEEYVKLVNLLQSDVNTFADAIGSVLSGSYGITSEQYDAILEKIERGEKLTDREFKINDTVVTETAAKMSENLLGTENFINKLVKINGSLAEKIVVKIQSLIETLSKLGDKEAMSQLRRLRNAEKLYLKAAEAAGNRKLIRMLGGDNEHESEQTAENGKKTPLTNINTENMHVSEETEETKFSREFNNAFSEHDKPITVSDVETLRSIGRKSINEFTPEDIEKSQKWAYKFYKELGAKSPFFRAWFGDWRAHEKTTVPIVYSNNRENYKAGKVENHDVNTVISWGHDLKSETNNHLVGEKASKDALFDIEKLVKNAIYFNTSVSMPTSKTKMLYTSFMHSFYTVYIKEDGTAHLIKIFVEEALSNNQKSIFKRAYQLKDIKTVAGIPNSVLSKYGGLTEDTPTTNISISDLFEFVKRYDAEFKPKTVNKFLLNEDGTPKVFYHGTNADFDRFDLSKSGTNFGETSEGMFFFTNKKEKYPNSAEDYARHAVSNSGGKEKIFECYLKMSNPLIVNSSGYYDAISCYDANADSIYEKYFDNDYDGILVMDSTKRSGDTILALVDNATQIKSATDNIGTFSPDDEKIQFSREVNDVNAKNNITMTRGEAKKRDANYKSDKVYSKGEAEAMIASLTVLESLPPKLRKSFTEELWYALNSELSDDKRKFRVSLIAKRIMNALYENAYSPEDTARIRKLESEIRALRERIEKAKLQETKILLF